MKINLNPWSYLFITFALLIFAGTIFLKLPFVEHSGGLSFIDALFTSTSAVCVTGLIVVDTGEFNLWGQIIILILIQIGAIGIMILTSSLLLFIRGELKLSHKFLVAKITDSFSIKEAERVLIVVIIYTFFIEFLGFIFLSLGFFLNGFDLGDSLYFGLFHSISAFCNAGFSTFAGSLTDSNAIIKIVTIFLIVLGGLGFFVVYNISEFINKRERIKVHTKIVLYTTFYLIIGGWILIYLLEKGDISFLDSLFHSVTARTAGFNTVDMNSFHVVSLFFTVVLMIIGASPGSTGGGIKTTTFFIALASMYNVLKGRKRVVIFKRTVPYINILKAYALITFYIFFLVICTMLLLYTSEFNFMDTLFEVASALGTVGLSLGITGQLDYMGKIIIIICMFLGRLGPATLMMMLIMKEKTSKISYPEEKIILG